MENPECVIEEIPYEEVGDGYDLVSIRPPNPAAPPSDDHEAGSTSGSHGGDDSSDFYLEGDLSGQVESLPSSRASTLASPSRGTKREMSWEDVKKVERPEKRGLPRSDSMPEHGGSCQSPAWSDIASSFDSDNEPDNKTDWAQLYSSVVELKKTMENNQRSPQSRRIRSPFSDDEDATEIAWDSQRLGLRRVSLDWKSDPICVKVPPSVYESGKSSRRSTPSHSSPLLSPTHPRAVSPAPLAIHEGLYREQVAKKEPHVRHNIFAERSPLPANFHPHSHSNPDAKSNRSSYLSMISTAASFFFRAVVDVEGESGMLSLMDTSFMQPKAFRGSGKKRDCYNLHGDNEYCEDCVEAYEVS